MSDSSPQSWDVLMKTGDMTSVHGVTEVTRGPAGDSLDFFAEDGLQFTAPIVAVAYAQRVEPRMKCADASAPPVTVVNCDPEDIRKALGETERQAGRA